MRRLIVKIPQDRGRLYDLIRYPAGEIQVRLTRAGLESLKRKDELEVIANPIPDLIELAQVKDAFENAKWMKDGGIFRTRLFIPYLPYARADRRFVPGDTFGLGVFAELINSMKFDSVWTFDVHSGVAVDLIPNLVVMKPTDGPIDQIKPIIKDLGSRGLVLIAPDKGATERYQLEQYKRPVVVGVKFRDAATGALSRFDVSVQDYSKVERATKGLIVDDICDGGGTFIGLGEAIKKINPKIQLSLYVSHGIFSKGTSSLYKVFENLYISDYTFEGLEQKESNSWETLK